MPPNLHQRATPSYPQRHREHIIIRPLYSLQVHVYIFYIYNCIYMYIMCISAVPTFQIATFLLTVFFLHFSARVCIYFTNTRDSSRDILLLYSVPPTRSAAGFNSQTFCVSVAEEKERNRMAVEIQTSYILFAFRPFLRQSFRTATIVYVDLLLTRVRYIVIQ